MPFIDAVVECPIFDSFRVQQISGMFDVAPATKCRERFSVEVPGLEEDWQVGVIVGPSGSGKSTIARKAFGENLYEGSAWPGDKAIVDCFGDAPVKAVTHALASVGFSSPPSWIKPYHVLSNGEKFRCDLAKSLLGESNLVVFDEFTSVVDRTVAQIGSAAVSKAIRSGKINRRFVAVACHYDIVDWLEPDWVVDMATQSLARGRLRRPQIRLDVHRVSRDIWKLFKRHHYLSAEIHKAAKCFLATIDGRPAAFCAVLHFPHPIRSAWREHRTVCLPDFQGVGIGNALSDYVGSLFKATGKPYRDTTSHPAHTFHRDKSPLWRCTREASLMQPHAKSKTAMNVAKIMQKTGSHNRLTIGWEYIGPSRTEDARRLGVI